MHSIHLRHGWSRTQHAGCVRWSRTFNWPARLEPSEKVWLVLDPQPERVRVWLNEGELSAGCEISTLLKQHNRLEIELPDGGAGEMPYEVRLDIDTGLDIDTK